MITIVKRSTVGWIRIVTRRSIAAEPALRCYIQKQMNPQVLSQVRLKRVNIRWQITQYSVQQIYLNSQAQKTVMKINIMDSLRKHSLVIVFNLPTYLKKKYLIFNSTAAPGPTG